MHTPRLILAAVLVCATTPALADGEVQKLITPADKARLEDYGKVRDEAIAAAKKDGAAEDVATLRQAHDRVRAALADAAGLALDRLSIASPFVERARYNAYAALAILPVHARRHLWQAEQTVRRSSAG